MKLKLLNAALIISSLIGFLQWGQGNSTFLFAAEAEIITKLFSDPLSVAHPFTFLPLIGQILLLITLFQKQPSKALTYTGMICVGLLLLFIFLIGILSLNFKILLSALPFMTLSVLTIIYFRRNRKKSVT